MLVCLACDVGCDKAPGGGGAGSASVVGAPSAVGVPSAAASGSAGATAEGAEPEGDEEGSAVAAAAPTSWSVGTVVQVKRDSKWYEAEIVAAGPKYKVLYTFADTVEDNIDPARLRVPKWAKKNKVEAQVGSEWTRGTVVARHREDGSYDIALDDGETKTFSAAQVRGLRKPKSVPHASAASSSGGGGVCVGASYMMRCGGSCVDTHLDDNNCGQCGSRCQLGKHCDGHGFCRDAQGNL